MTQSIHEIMTPDPATLSVTATVADAAHVMAERGVGDVVVHRNGNLVGIVTDRDLVVRVMAEGQDPARTRLDDVCSAHVVTVAPDDDVGAAVRLMTTKAVRRLPVDQDGKLVGIVSMGDLAIELDPESALAEISAAPAGGDDSGHES